MGRKDLLLLASELLQEAQEVLAVHKDLVGRGFLDVRGIVSAEAGVEEAQVPEGVKVVRRERRRGRVGFTLAGLRGWDAPGELLKNAKRGVGINSVFIPKDLKANKQQQSTITIKKNKKRDRLTLLSRPASPTAHPRGDAGGHHGEDAPQAPQRPREATSVPKPFAASAVGN